MVDEVVSGEGVEMPIFDYTGFDEALMGNLRGARQPFWISRQRLPDGTLRLDSSRYLKPGVRGIIYFSWEIAEVAIQIQNLPSEPDIELSFDGLVGIRCGRCSPVLCEGHYPVLVGTSAQHGREYLAYVHEADKFCAVMDGAVSAKFERRSGIWETTDDFILVCRRWEPALHSASNTLLDG